MPSRSLLTHCLARARAGTYFDPDDLQITLRRAGTKLTAHSVDWEISGVLTSETTARLAGLDGTLSSSGIAWTNGVEWSRTEVAPVAAPSWSGGARAARMRGAVPCLLPP